MNQICYITAMETANIPNEDKVVVVVKNDTTTLDTVVYKDVAARLRFGQPVKVKLEW